MLDNEHLNFHTSDLKDLACWCLDNLDLGTNLEFAPKFFHNEELQELLERQLRDMLGGE